MFDDMFKMRYKEIPFAIFERKRQSDSTGDSITTVLHNHREVEILVIRSGEALFSVNEQSYPARTGDIVLISPYYPHHIRFFDDGTFSDSCICFDLKMLGDDQLQSDLEAGHLSLSPVITGAEADKLRKYADAAIDAFQQQREGWKLEVTGNMMLFFGWLKSDGRLTVNLHFDRKKDFCCKIFRYIEIHFPEPIASRDAAAALFLNNSYFCRAFKKHFGQTFSQYLCFYRLEKSRTRLFQTGKTISEIAAESGFRCESYYIRMFRETYGETPGEYHKRLRREEGLETGSFKLYTQSSYPDIREKQK